MRVVIAEDSMLLRQGIVRVLESAGFDVVGEAGGADELLRQVRERRPDVAVIDIRMPPDHVDEGLRAARAIRAEQPGVGVLDLSDDAPVETAEEVAARIEAALEFVEPERLQVAPDCGMKYLPRDVAFAKLLALVEGAERVRARLTGPGASPGSRPAP